MEPRVQYILAAIEKAEVSMTDVSRLTGVSRVTLYRWKNEANIKDKLRLNMVYTMAQRFEKACRAGRLPFPNKLKVEQRIGALRKIVAEMAQK